MYYANYTYENGKKGIPSDIWGTNPEQLKRSVIAKATESVDDDGIPVSWYVYGKYGPYDEGEIY